LDYKHSKSIVKENDINCVNGCLLYYQVKKVHLISRKVQEFQGSFIKSNQIK